MAVADRQSRMIEHTRLHVMNWMVMSCSMGAVCQVLTCRKAGRCHADASW